MKKKNKVLEILKKFKFLICIIVGVAIGLIFKEKATSLRPIGTLFVNFIFVIIVPLVFLSVTLSIAKINNQKKLRKIFLYSLIVFLVTLVITGLLTIGFSLLFNPYENVSIATEPQAVEKVDLFTRLINMVSVNDFSGLFTKSNALPLVVISVLIALAISKLSNNKELIKRLEDWKEVVKNYLGIIMKFAPIGITCYLGALIGEYGSTFISSYVKIFLIYIGLGLFNIFVFHTIYLWFAGGKRLIKVYYKNLLRLMVTAVSTQSSVITMPTNIEVLEEMNLDKDLIDITTPVATLTNMQGNIIENLLKVFLVCTIFQIPMGGVGKFALYIMVAIFAGAITAGIPGGGVISNTILVSMLGFPVEVLPILITIEWLLDAPATAFNILSDTSTMPIIDKFLKRGKRNDSKRKKVYA